MMETNSPFATAKSTPLRTRVSTGPRTKVFVSSLVRMTCSISVPSEDGIKRIFPDDHPCRNVARDQRGHDEKPDAEQSLVEGRDQNAVREREIDGVGRERRYEDTVDENETEGGTHERIEYRLQDIRNFYRTSRYPDALQDADVFPARERVNEHHDEDGDGCDHETDGAERGAKQAERLNDVFHELRLSVFKGLNLCVLACAALQ